MRNMNRKERSTCKKKSKLLFWSLSFSFTDLQSFREALFILQHQVDELDKLKISHYEEIIEHEEEVWDVVQGKVSSCTQAVSMPLVILLYIKVCVVVRSTMDVFDRFTAKA